MSAQVANVTELDLGRRMARQIVWVGPEGDEGAWVMVSAQGNGRGLCVDVPAHAQLVSVAALRGRAIVLTREGEGWLEQPCACAVEREQDGAVTVLLVPDGTPRHAVQEIGAIPRT